MAARRTHLEIVDSVSDEELVLAAQDGDSGALQGVFERYRPRAKAKARSYFLMGADREDVVQESLIGLFKAIRDFDPSQQVSFRSFAELCMRSQVITAIKGATRNKHAPLNLSTSIFVGGDGDDDYSCLLDRRAEHHSLEDPVRLVLDAEEQDLLAGLLDDILSPLERQVIDFLLAGRSYTEIASSLDRSVKSIDNAAQRIRHKLHGRMRPTSLNKTETEADAEPEPEAAQGS